MVLSKCVFIAEKIRPCQFVLWNLSNASPQSVDSSEISQWLRQQEFSYAKTIPKQFQAR